MSGILWIVLGLGIEIAAAVLLITNSLKLKKFTENDVIKESSETMNSHLKKRNKKQNKSFLAIYLLLIGLACQIIGIALIQFETFEMIDGVWAELYGLRQELVDSGTLEP